MRLVSTISIALLVIGCDALRPAPPATVGSGLPIYSNPTDTATVSSMPNQPKPTDTATQDFGVVKCHSSQVNQFNNQVRNFLSTSSDPTQAQYIVDCANTPQWKGGFFIKGKIDFEGLEFFDTQSYNQNLTISRNSYLEIHIVSTTGRPVIPTIKMGIETFASAIRGQDASLVFQDQKGKVFLNGTVSNNEKNGLLFSGTFEFENFTTWDGSNQGLSGAIGTFTIPACRFFECESQTLPESL